MGHVPAFDQAREADLLFLAHRPRSEAEVLRRLRDRYPAPLAELVVQRLKEQQLLNDASFASQWRRDREEHRPRAKGLVRQELRRLGVPMELADQALEGFDDVGNAYRAGQRLARRLAGAQEPEVHFRRRIGEHLRRRGFGHNLAAQTAARLWAELADPLHCDVDADGDERQSPNIKTEGLKKPAD